MSDYNVVVNAFFLHSLRLMSRIADALNRSADAADFRSKAERGLTSFNKTFWDASQQCYVDGEGVKHASAHANFFPLAFGLVPEERKPAVLRFVKTRGMAPSVYGAQYLLESLYDGGEDDYALSLMTSTAERSWWNMLAMGSTITTEAWAQQYKPNMDWNHAWGSAPANIVPRFILGLKAIEPGFGQVEIRPQPGSLSFAEGVVPTIRGPVGIRVEQSAGSELVRVEIPGNMVAKIALHAPAGRTWAVSADGRKVAARREQQYLVVDGIGSGRHELRCTDGSRQ
jgi:hypothetical protein